MYVSFYTLGQLHCLSNNIECPGVSIARALLDNQRMTASAALAPLGILLPPSRHDDCTKQSRLRPSVLCEIPNFLACPAWQDDYLAAICDDDQIVDAVHRNAHAVGVDEVTMAAVYANGTR